MAIFSIADTFIKRPVLSTVCTLLILLAGGIAIPLLPINNLPDIAPITVRTSAVYIGADAETIENTVTSTLERGINGVENMEYISSISTNTGGSSISTSFGVSTDKNINQVNVQNRASTVIPSLPAAVQQLGVSSRLVSTSILMVYGFYGEEGSGLDNLFISNYLDLFVLDELQRLPGVGDISILGERKYAMRLWLDPDALASRQLTASDVANALRSQNIQVGAGSIGSEPAPAGQAFDLSLRVQGRLAEVEDFGNLVLKSEANGTLVKLKDVGRVELGAEGYGAQVNLGGKPGVGLAIYQLPGSNALDTAAAVKEKLAELEQAFPPGMNYVSAFDVTDFISGSIRSVVITLFQAIFLVVLIIFVFLQDWRTTLIPAIAIPVALIGAMAMALAFGFSLNNLTLFGLILASGLVVDDAIVIVEAITTKLEEGLSPREAALACMNELTGAVISTSLVLIAVFVPVAFFPGSVGIIYQQFAMTIAFTVLFSTFNAITFTPTLSALILRPPQPRRGPLGAFFRGFNSGLAGTTARYTEVVRGLIRIRWLIMGGFAAGLVLTVWVYGSIPTGFVPEADQGLLIGIIQAPDGVSVQYTDRVGQEVDAALAEEPDIETRLVAAGFGLSGNAPNQGTFFARLKDWRDRPRPDQSVQAILERLNQRFAQNQDALIIGQNIPALPGFGSSGGFELQLQDRSGGRFSLDEFFSVAQQIIAKANQDPAMTRVFTQFSVGTPQLEIRLDRDRLAAMNVDFAQATGVLAAYVGGQYVNDFTFGQRSYRVYIQADADHRNDPRDLDKLYVRSRTGDLVRLSEVAQIEPIAGPQIINRFNLYRAIRIQGQAAPGFSSGQAIAAMERIIAEVAPPGIGYEWSGLSREEKAAGGQAAVIFALGLVVVFLVLAAQYENYIDPLIIMLTVPLAILGAMAFVGLRGMANDIYVQVALVMLIGLASKNAILIVEFANQARQEGLHIVEAAVQAAKERFRPILMTAISSLFGFFPLVVASGVGSANQRSVGTAVFGGLLVATVLSFLVVPVLYVVIKKLTDRFIFGKTEEPPTPPSPPLPPSGGGGNTFPGDGNLPQTSGSPAAQPVPKIQGENPA